MVVPAGTVIIFCCGTGAGPGRAVAVPVNPAIIPDNTIAKIL
jgi:hypothetical protein